MIFWFLSTINLGLQISGYMVYVYKLGGSRLEQWFTVCKIIGSTHLYGGKPSQPS